MISAVSYSRLSVYEECPARAKMAFADKIKPIDRDPPPPGKEYPDERGSRVHNTAEAYVRGASMPCSEMESFLEEYEVLRRVYIEENDRIELEQTWAFRDDWTPTVWNDWDNVWLRIKTDLTAWLSGSSAVVVDYKTGRAYGNEVKHTQQGQLYAVGAFMMYPQLEEVWVELWYLDHNTVMQHHYKRHVVMQQYFKKWDKRLRQVTEASHFPFKANDHTCRYCPYKTGLIGKLGPEGTGDCDRNP